jgi:hypothetical protein
MDSNCGEKIRKSLRLVKTGVNLTSFGPVPIIRKSMKANLFWEGIGMESGAELEKRAYDLMASGLN